jgi:hypothetical protein
MLTLPSTAGFAAWLGGVRFKWAECRLTPTMAIAPDTKTPPRKGEVSGALKPAVGARLTSRQLQHHERHPPRVKAAYRRQKSLNLSGACSV